MGFTPSFRRGHQLRLKVSDSPALPTDSDDVHVRTYLGNLEAATVTHVITCTTATTTLLNCTVAHIATITGCN
jgi:hypothetical protein